MLLSPFCSILHRICRPLLHPTQHRSRISPPVDSPPIPSRIRGFGSFAAWRAQPDRPDRSRGPPALAIEGVQYRYSPSSTTTSKHSPFLSALLRQILLISPERLRILPQSLARLYLLFRLAVPLPAHASVSEGSLITDCLSFLSAENPSFPRFSTASVPWLSEALSHFFIKRRRRPCFSHHRITPPDQPCLHSVPRPCLRSL